MFQRTHQVMSEFKDEDKYVGLTKRQLCWAIPGVFLILFFTKLFLGMHLIEAAMFVDIIIIGFTAVMMIIKLPEDRMYLTGGGLFLQTVLLRIVLRKFKKNRVIYTKLHSGTSL